MIGLSRGRREGASGYQDMADFCSGRCELVSVDSYDLHLDSDKERLLKLDLDILLVTGWQRIIPGWLIKHAKVCTVGIHGSPYGITKGRGRSPQTWALILGKRRLNISIFYITPEVDAGPVIASKSFELTSFDDIKTSYLKCGEVAAELITANLKNGRMAKLAGRSQPSSGTYLPKREPEDGEIDWRRSTRQIYDFVRAQTHPYPGAFSNVNGASLIIWKGRPFASNADRARPGTVGRVFVDGRFTVRTGDGWFLVDEHQWTANAREMTAGTVIPSCDFRKQMQRIVARHKARYPELELHHDILALCR